MAAAATGFVFIVKVTVVLLAGTTTEFGGAKVELLAEIATVNPPFGAGALSVSVA